MKKWLKSENGAAQIVEAAVIYPVVFLCLFVLIYLGLYILQQQMIESYAQKIAIIAAREVAYPGYLDLADNNIYKTGAVEGDFAGSSILINNGAIVKCSFDSDKVKTDAYRYWKPDPLDEKSKQALVNILTGDNSSLVKSHSLLGSGKATASICCKNNIISQSVEVEITQELMKFSILEYFGIDTPTVKAKAVATVSDCDEFVRNTNFVVNTMETLAEKLGINVSEMKENVNKALDKLGLV